MVNHPQPSESVTGESSPTRELARPGVVSAIVCPIAALLIAIPIGLLPAAGDLRPESRLFSALLAVPFWAGVLAAPGYWFLFRYRPKRTTLSGALRTWVRCSLGLATLAATLGGLATFVMPLFAPSAFALVATLKLWRRFEADVP